MKFLALTFGFLFLLSCKTTYDKSDASLSSNVNKGKKSNTKRIAYFNPPSDSGLTSDFTQDVDGWFLTKLVDQSAYPLSQKPIPEREWNIMTYDCNRFASDAVLHLAKDYYVWVLSYTHSHKEQYENWDMRHLSGDQLGQLQTDIPDPRLTKFDGSIFKANTWKKKYETLSKMVEDSGMHSGTIIKMRKWIDEGGYVRTQDVYAYIEPQSGYYVVDWPVEQGVAPTDKEVARTLLHHMHSQIGYFGIIGDEGKAVFDPSDLVKETYYCGAKTKVAFDWKNPASWIFFTNNNITRIEHCKGCCADKTSWAARNHDTDGIEYNIDAVYNKWYDECRSVCNIMFSK